MSSRLINSNDIEDKNIPEPPSIGYYDLDKDGTKNSASTIKSLLGQNCGNIGSDFLYSDKDQVYIDTITGTINEQCNQATGVSAGSDTLTGQINNACSSDKNKITNQIKYLACQLATARSRLYQSSKEKVDDTMNVKEIFDRFSNIHWVMVAVFFLSMYFLIQGFFSSFDVASNMLNVIEDNASKSIYYYIALFAGVSVPVIILCILFVRSICDTLESVEKYNITTDPEGKKEEIGSGFKRIDYSVLVLFILLIYAFVFVLFSVKREAVGNLLYMIIIGGILFVIAIFLYLFYAFIPFFATANKNNIGNEEQPLKLFVDKQEDTSKITTNQDQVQHLQKVFGITAIIIGFIFVGYMAMSKNMKNSEGGKLKDILSGFFGASAILIVPILWVLNFVLATRYFYIYPLILLGFRFLRYVGMGILFVQYNSAKSYGMPFGENFSDDLKNQLDDFANYSPSWNLVGIDIVKSLLNIFGYNNIFSENYRNNNKFNNLSSNRYVIPGLFSYAFTKGTDQENPNAQSRLMIHVFITILTIVFSSILLWSVYKIQK